MAYTEIIQRAAEIGDIPPAELQISGRKSLSFSGIDPMFRSFLFRSYFCYLALMFGLIGIYLILQSMDGEVEQLSSSAEAASSGWSPTVVLMIIAASTLFQMGVTIYFMISVSSVMLAFRRVFQSISDGGKPKCLKLRAGDPLQRDADVLNRAMIHLRAKADREAATTRSSDDESKVF